MPADVSFPRYHRYRGIHQPEIHEITDLAELVSHGSRVQRDLRIYGSYFQRMCETLSSARARARVNPDALMDDIVDLYEETFLPSMKQLFISLAPVPNRTVGEDPRARSLENRSHNSPGRKWQKSLSQAYESHGHLRESSSAVFHWFPTAASAAAVAGCRSRVGARRRGVLPLLLSLFMSDDIATPRRLRAP